MVQITDVRPSNPTLSTTHYEGITNLDIVESLTREMLQQPQRSTLHVEDSDHACTVARSGASHGVADMCICDREIEQGATGASCWPIGVASILAGFMCSHNVARHEVHKYQLRGSISNIRSGWLVDENGVGHTWSHHPAGQKGTTTPWS